MPKRGYHHGNLRQALIDAALKLIEDRGPTGFTLSEAAKQAGVTPAAVYRHFEGREDLIAEAALQGYEIFADVMDYAYDSGKPSALAAFEATGRAYLAFARKHPGHYIAMFESGVSVNKTPDLAAASARARGVLEKAAEGLSQHIPADKRPPSVDAVAQRFRLGLLSNLAGLGVTLLALEATVGFLVAKTLTNATANPFLAGAAQGYNPVLALDVFLVQAAVNVCIGHFGSLAFNMWLQRCLQA